MRPSAARGGLGKALPRRRWALRPQDGGLGRPTTDDRGTGATCWLPGRVEKRSLFTGCRARGRSERQSPRWPFSAGVSAPRAGGVVVSWLERREGRVRDNAPTRSRRTPAGEARAGAAAGRVAPRPLRQLHRRARPPRPRPAGRRHRQVHPRAHSAAYWADIPIDDRAEPRAEPPSPSAAHRSR